MQLTLEFPDLPNPPASPAPTPWDQLDEATRIAPLEILSCLIARMLAARQAEEPIDE
jgi:hypothetical protein